MAGQKDEFAIGNIERQILDRVEPAGIALGNLLELDHGWSVRAE